MAGDEIVDSKKHEETMPEDVLELKKGNQSAILFINPGTADIPETTEQNARKNIKVFVADLAEKGVKVKSTHRRPNMDGFYEGRYAYLLFLKKPQPQVDSFEPGLRKKILIHMPGVPLEKVRFMGTPEQDVLEFPRLYVDGWSWLWLFALNICMPEETDDESDDELEAEPQGKNKSN